MILYESSSQIAYAQISWIAILGLVIPIIFGFLLYPKKENEIKTGSMSMGAFAVVWVFPVLVLTVRITPQ